MKVFLGGARGSFPVSGPDYVRYGGETFSLLAEGRDGTQILVDAGTGVRRFRQRLRPGAMILFTHTHLDHLLGLPLLQKTWPAQWVLPLGDLQPVLDRLFTPPIWPVKLPPVHCLDAVPPLTTGALQITWHAVAHPDGCVAYRLAEPATGASVVVATDIEWALMTPRAQDDFVRFALHTDLLVFDTQFLPGEYEAHRGWGHSTWAHAIEAAKRAKAAKVWLMHHNPSRSDAELDSIARIVAAEHPAAVFPTVDNMSENLHE